MGRKLSFVPARVLEPTKPRPTLPRRPRPSPCDRLCCRSSARPTERARLRFKSSIDGTVRASISPLTRRPGPPQLFVLVVRPSAGAPLARRRLFLLLFLLPLCGAAATAMGARARAPAPRGARVGGSSRLTLARTSRAAVVLSSSSSWTVVVLVSRLLFGRRSVRSEGAACAVVTGACCECDLTDFF